MTNKNSMCKRRKQIKINIHQETVAPMSAWLKAAMEQVAALVSEYEQFTFTSLKTGETRTVLQYPTYYAGCCLWGRIDLALGKERLFEALASYDGFLDAWREAEGVLH